MLISVIITTKNEENNIANCLKSIKEQTHPQDKIEIIVVDNDSIDKTKEIAIKYTDLVFDLVEETQTGGIKSYRGAQLNLGVSKAKGKIIFFPDADMSFDRTLLEEAVSKLEYSDALYVPEIIVGRGFLGKTRRFERSFYNMTCIDAIRMIKKDVFIEVNGFDSKNISFGPDDWDFTKTLQKYGFILRITKSCLYHHEEWMTVGTYISKKANYSNTFDGYIKKWGRSDPDIKKQFGLWYRYLGVFIENGKWRILIVHPLLTIGMVFLRFIVGIIFIFRNKWKIY